MAAGTEEGHGRAGPGQARPGAERRKAAGGRVGRGCEGWGSPSSRCYQRRACGWRPDGGSRVLRARVGLRTPVRSDPWTVPLSLRLDSGRRRRRPLPLPPPTPRTKSPHPDSPSAAAAKSSAAYWLSAAAPTGKCSPGFGARGAKGGRGQSAGREGGAGATTRNVSNRRESRREVRPRAITAERPRKERCEGERKRNSKAG